MKKSFYISSDRNLMEIVKDWRKVSFPPDTSRKVRVKYKNNAPYNAPHFVTEGKLHYDANSDKFLTKKNRNKTNRISHWKDI